MEPQGFKSLVFTSEQTCEGGRHTMWAVHSTVPHTIYSWPLEANYAAILWFGLPGFDACNVLLQYLLEFIKPRGKYSDTTF
jgi:hypothetical protein